LRGSVQGHDDDQAEASSVCAAQNWRAEPAAIYSSIPKNACSTLRFSVALANGCVAEGADVNRIHENNETFKPTLAELVRANYAFVVLRDRSAASRRAFSTSSSTRGRKHGASARWPVTPSNRTT
jgi:hypothetical protein